MQDFEKIISLKTKFSLQEKSKRSIQVIASKHSKENQSARSCLDLQNNNSA